MDMSLSSSSNSSLHPPLHECLTSRVCTSIYTALFIGYIVLFPLSIFVLYVGYQRWRKQRPVATAVMTSHSDVFTFNMAVLELIGVLGFCSYSLGTYTNHFTLIMMGSSTYNIISPGQTLFHLLTCVDRYLAVVHPVTYLGLKQVGGVRIRNISTGCVWLLSFVSLGLSHISVVVNVIYSSLLLVSSSIVISFCSISVLCVLIRPGPGEVGGDRERVDQSKQRAFNTIMAIMGALLLRFSSRLVSIVIHASPVSDSCDVICLVASVTDWFSLPSSLVLPLLFLHRAGKLPACKHNTQSG